MLTKIATRGEQDDGHYHTSVTKMGEKNRER